MSKRAQDLVPLSADTSAGHVSSLSAQRACLKHERGDNWVSKLHTRMQAMNWRWQL